MITNTRYIDAYKVGSATRLSDLLGFGHLKPLSTINLPISPTFLGNFYKAVKNPSFF